MGPRQIEQGALFYNFSLDAHVPADNGYSLKPVARPSRSATTRPLLTLKTDRARDPQKIAV